MGGESGGATPQSPSVTAPPFAPKRPFGTFRCCAWLNFRKEHTELFTPKRSCFRFASLPLRVQGSQGNGVPSPPRCKGRWIGIAETEGLPSFAGYTPQGNNPSVTSGDSSPYILRTVTFLRNVPVFRMAYFSIRAHCALIEKTLMLQPLRGLRRGSHRNGVLLPPLCKGRWHSEAVTEGLMLPPFPSCGRSISLYRCGRASTRSMARRYSSSVFRCSMIMGISGFTASAQAM